MNIGFVIALGGLFLWLLFGLVGFIQRRSQKRRDEYRDREVKVVDGLDLLSAMKKSYYSGDRNLFKRGKQDR